MRGNRETRGNGKYIAVAGACIDRHAAPAAAICLALLALSAGAWYARRRWARYAAARPEGAGIDDARWKAHRNFGREPIDKSVISGKIDALAPTV